MAHEPIKLQICQLAATMVGAGPLTSLEDDNDEPVAIFCRQVYEPLVESELSTYKWKFATHLYNLKPLLLSSAPLSRANVSYQLPTNPAVMSIDTVLVNDRPIFYERFGDEINTTDTSADDVILQYRFRADERKWSPFFRMYMTYLIASGIAGSVTRKVDQAEKMADMAADQLKRSKVETAQAQPMRPLNLNQLLNQRRGTIHKFWRDR